MFCDGCAGETEIVVVATLAWPRGICTVVKSVPCATCCVAMGCLRVCTAACRIPVSPSYCATIYSITRDVIRALTLVTKRPACSTVGRILR